MLDIYDFIYLLFYLIFKKLLVLWEFHSMCFDHFHPSAPPTSTPLPYPTKSLTHQIPFVLPKYSWMCAWPSIGALFFMRGGTLKENWISASQSLSIANSSSTRDGTSCSHAPVFYGLSSPSFAMISESWKEGTRYRCPV